MSLSPNSSLIQRTIDLNYVNKKRSKSLKWIILNSVLLLVFVYDLSLKCPGHTAALHYVELACAGVCAANLVQYAVRLAPGCARAPPVALSRAQQALLGLADHDLDSSFVRASASAAAPRGDEAEWSVSDAELSLSLSPSPRQWRPPAPRTPPSPAPPSPAPPPSPPQDRFIADQHSLTAYLKQYEERSATGAAAAAWTPLAARPPYQLAALDGGGNQSEESAPPGCPEVWWSLDLDPRRLTQWNLNLRLWVHVTILERLVRAVDAADAALARAGLAEAGTLCAGRVPVARVARAAPALRPFLEPVADQPYLLRRLRELARGGCLSAYRWDGGGAGWDGSQPTDAELLLHLVATYLDGQVPAGGGARPFSAAHVREAAAEAGASGDAPVIVRVRARPPQYALALGGARLAPGGGRNNLLHTLLLFLAAAARRDPPALARLHLGPAGLNMLWIIGR